MVTEDTDKNINLLLVRFDDMLQNLHTSVETCTVKNIDEFVTSWHIIENELDGLRDKMSAKQENSFDDNITDFHQYLDKYDKKCVCFRKDSLGR